MDTLRKLLLSTIACCAVAAPCMAQSLGKATPQWAAVGAPDDLAAGVLCDKFTVNGVPFAINVHDADAALRWGKVLNAYALNEPVEVATVFNYTPPFPFAAPMVMCFGSDANGNLVPVAVTNAIAVR